MEKTDKSKKTEQILEAIFLVILLGSMLYFVNGKLSDNRITHEYPYTYFASDAFSYLFLSQHLYDNGNQKYHPFYAADGHYDVLWIHGLTVYSTTVMFAKISGIEVYDALFFISSLMVILNALLVYLIIKDYNKKIAILSSALFAFFFVKNFYFTYLWGQLGAVSGMLFMTGIIWCMMRKDMKKSILLLILFFCATIFAHIPELVFAMIFIIIFYIFKTIIEKKVDKEDIKRLFIAGIVSIIITSYYLVLFYFGMFQTQGSTEFWYPPEAMAGVLRVVFFPDFSIPIIILLSIGVILSLYYIFLKKKFHAALIMAISFFLIGFANYCGIGARAFHVRAFWPLYIAPLLGIGIYFLIKFVLKEIKQITAIIISILLFMTIVYAFYMPIKGPGMMDKDHWQMFQWLGKNTGEKDKIFMFYGDGYDQNGRAIPRLVYVINTDDYINSLRNNTIKRYYKAQILTLHQGNLMYWKSFMTPGYHTLEENFNVVNIEDVCSFEYYVFDKQSAYAPGITQANMYIRNLFIKNGMKEVYVNNIASVIRNYNVGGNCIDAT